MGKFVHCRIILAFWTTKPWINLEKSKDNDKSFFNEKKAKADKQKSVTVDLKYVLMSYSFEKEHSVVAMKTGTMRNILKQEDLAKHLWSYFCFVQVKFRAFIPDVTVSGTEFNQIFIPEYNFKSFRPLNKEDKPFQ